MTEIFLYAFGVMYSPGPVNILGMNSGFSGRFKASFGFFSGVGIAMAFYFLLFGYAGEKLVSLKYLPYIMVVGCGYILYQAYKIMVSAVDITDPDARASNLRFHDGLLIQLLNPKAMLAIIPITSVQFPAAGVTGIKIFFVSLVLAVMAMWAPGFYSFVGSVIGKKVTQSVFFRIFNFSLGGMMIVSAGTMLYEHVYLKLA